MAAAILEQAPKDKTNHSGDIKYLLHIPGSISSSYRQQAVLMPWLACTLSQSPLSHSKATARQGTQHSTAQRLDQAARNKLQMAAPLNHCNNVCHCP
jgi:hypothetical protein